MKAHKSLLFKLTSWYVVLLVLTISILNVSLYKFFNYLLVKGIDVAIYAVADELLDILEQQPPGNWRDAIEHEEQEKDDFNIAELYIQVLSIHNKSEPNPVVSLKSRSLQRQALPYFPEMLDKVLRGESFYAYHGADEAFRSPVRFIMMPGFERDGTTYILQVGASLKDVVATTNQLLTYLLLSSALFFILVAGGGYLILRRALVPVKKVVAAARKINAENLSQRIDAKNRQDEIGELVVTFNDMLDRLERSIAHIRQFTSDASHELKTPLSVINGEVEIALSKKRSTKEYEETLKTVLEEGYSLKSLIDNLLCFSRLEEQPKQANFQTVMLDDVVLKVFERVHPLAQTKHIALDLRSLDTISIIGDEILLHQMVFNLLDNAIKYTPENGRAEISLTRENACAALSVQDTGIGIPDESLPYIFDRFYRVDKARSRTGKCFGLGLAIVKRIAEYHNAKIDVRSTVGQGTMFKILYPLPEDK